MGGSWEAFVRSAKQALHLTLSHRTIDDETFSTVFANATGLLNSSPLSIINDDPTNPLPLTLNHFLIGQASGGTALDVFSDKKVSSRKRSRAAQKIS